MIEAIEILLVITGIICAVILSGFFSALETAAYGANKTRLSALQSQGSAGATSVLSQLMRMPKLITTMLVGTNLFVDSGAHLLTGYLHVKGTESAEAITTLILTPLFFIFAESLPKRLAYKFSNDLLLSSSRITAVFVRLFTPLVLMLGISGTLIRSILKRFGLKAVESTGKSQIIEKLEAEAAEGSLAEEQYDMARRIIDLETLTVGEVMLPFSQSVLIENRQTCEQAGRKIIQSGYARGLLTDHAGQLTGRFVTLNSIIRNPGALEQPVDSVAADAMRVNSRTPVMKAMNRMRENGVRLAIATGPGGASVGVVPFRKLLGCVTGDLKI